MEKVKGWKEAGIIRRFGALVAHRRAGITANGMVVWDVPDEDIEKLGAIFAAHKAVSHCYSRPRFTGWPYRLYTMVHGKTREQVNGIAKELSASSGCDKYSILFSTREFKKSDTRLFFERYAEAR
jgi:DNA-binding Lrp family transcriptional regulator